MELVQIEKDDWIFRALELSSAIDDEFDHALDFWNDGDYKNAEMLLRSIVARSTSHIDAYHHLSMVFDETSRELEAYLCCREAVRIGLEAIPGNFHWKTSRLNWGSISNRPFMRAYHSLGLWHQRRNELEPSITVFSRLLAVCPNDNLGVRYLLPKLWLEKGDVLSVVRHCKEFEDDVAPEIIYTYPLALILSGETTKAKELLAAAKRQLPLVAKELRKKRHPRPKSSMPGYISHGGADQAYEYWVQYGRYWNESETAMTLLSEM